MAVVSAGRPLLALSEVRGQVERIESRTRPDQVGSSVRVIGRLVEFDAATACALIERGGCAKRMRAAPVASWPIWATTWTVENWKQELGKAPTAPFWWTES